MFICAEMIRDVAVGEVIIVKNDVFGSGLGAYLITGEKVAEVSSSQAEGCLDFWTLATRIENNRIVCKAAIKGARLLILTTESRLFSSVAPVSSLVSRCVS